MPKVPLYEPNVKLRPAFQQGIDVRATPEAFGAAEGRGMQQLAQGVGQAASAFAQVQALEDETMARAARNEFVRATDELKYGENGFLQKEGKAAIDGFGEYQRQLGELKQKYANGLTPAQSSMFSKAIEPLANDATRTALIHKGKALKTFVVQEAANGADNSKNEAVRNYGDPALHQKYTAAGLTEIQTLGEKQGWSPEKLKAEQQTYLSDTHRLTALEIANADPVAALEYVSKNREAMSPVDHINTMRSLMPMVAPAITRDAITTRETPAAPEKRATIGNGGPTNTRAFLIGKLAGGHGADHVDGLDARFAGDLAALMQGAPPEIAKGLGIFSGYRSTERQRQLFEASDKSGKWVAPPGRSLHNHGQAVDLSWNGQSLAKAPQEVKDWVHQNAGKFGIYFPMSYEPWHAEPIGSRGGTRTARPVSPDQMGDTTQSVPASHPRAQFAVQFFQERGYSAAQAAGIVGNLIAESGLRSNASHDGNTGMGIAGHRNERLAGLRKFASARGKPATDFATQLEFIAHELDTSEAGTKAALARAKTPQEAAEAFISFERPQGYAPGGDLRVVSGYQTRVNAAIEAAGGGRQVRGVTVAGVAFSPRVEKLLSDLPANYALRIREAAAGGIAQADAQVAAQIKAQRTALVENYRLRIATADQALTQQEILEDDTIDDGDKASLVNSFNEKFGDTLKTQQAIGAFQAGQLAIDPYDAAGKKLVDGTWQSLSAAVPEDQRRATLAELVRQAGVVPQPIVNAIRGALTSQTPADVVNAATLAAQLHAINPAAFGRRDGGKGVSDAAVMFSTLVHNTGMTTAQAAQHLIDARDPAKMKERAALMDSKPIKDFVKDQATESSVRDIFDPGLFGFDPKLGETPAQSAAMVAEYQDVLEQSVFDAAGNQDAAKALASERFKRRYGVSKFSIGGTGVVTRLPPEVTYPADLAGKRDYVRDQARAALKSAGVGARDVFLQSDTLTEQDFNAGKPPRYQVWYRDSNGVLERYHLPFYANAPSKDELAVARKAKSESRRDENMRNAEQAAENVRNVEEAHKAGRSFLVPYSPKPTDQDQ